MWYNTGVKILASSRFSYLLGLAMFSGVAGIAFSLAVVAR